MKPSLLQQKKNHSRLGGLWLFALFLLSFISIGEAKTHWQRLAPGLDYTNIQIAPKTDPAARVHAFRLNPKLYRLQLAQSDPNSASNTSLLDLAQAKNALIAINGGFFTPMGLALGLRIDNHQQLHALKNVKWWSVFSINDQLLPTINTTDQLLNNRQTLPEFAIQAGPRLIINGAIAPRLKGGASQRSALGIDQQGRVYLIATQNAYLTTTEFAAILRATQQHDGLALVNALNLDGGTSTQLYAHINSFFLHIPSFKGIADIIYVIPRSHS